MNAPAQPTDSRLRCIAPPAARLVLLVLLVCPVLLAGCASAPPDCCRKPAGAGVPSNRSLYQLRSRWTTDGNRPFELGQLAGRPQVVVMFFAQCRYACPVLVHNMKSIEAALPREMRAKVGFTLVSFDSRRDTPAVLAEYRRRLQLPKTGWNLLRGEPEDVLELAALLGVKFKEDAAGNFAHSNVITVLDAHGEIVRQVNGMNQEPTETVRVLQDLATEHKSSIR